MKPRFDSAVRVPLARVIAVALVLMPSFTLLARNDVVANPTDVSPVGAPAAEAHAVEMTAVATGAANRPAVAESSAFAHASWADAALGDIDPKVFELALRAAGCAVRTGAVNQPRTLTVIDYSKPSTQKRLWVFDVHEHELLFEELVAHGRGSGENHATAFSNVPDSHRTSLGLFVTDATYIGRNGYSLRMDGLEQGFNDRARERAIVMHGAPYVNASFAKAQGRIGRSHGCPALDDAIARKVIDTVRGGGLVFSYYPDENWLRTSRYLNGCGVETD